MVFSESGPPFHLWFDNFQVVPMESLQHIFVLHIGQQAYFVYPYQ